MDGMGGNGTHHMMMMMYFHTELMDTLFFKEWKIHSIGAVISAFFGLLLLGAAYEGLKVFRENLLHRSLLHNAPLKSASYLTNSGSLANGDMPLTETRPVSMQLLSGAHLFQTLLHMVQVLISFLLMLAFMTYNVWLCLAVVLGAGLGHFIFAWQRTHIARDNLDDHCN